MLAQNGRLLLQASWLGPSHEQSPVPQPDGLGLRAACCFGYSSEVAAELYCPVDLSETARGLGGGGHAAAAVHARTA